MKNINFTNITVFIGFFGAALFEAVRYGNWKVAALFVALGVLSLWVDFRIRKSRMNESKTIIERVRALQLPFGEYVVIGSGTMEALGIRSAEDVDIAALPGLYERLRATGEWREEQRWDKIFLIKDAVEVSPQLSWEDYITTTEEAISSALVIDGIPFLNLDELKKFKRALGREKDKKDIRLIEEFLTNNG